MGLNPYPSQIDLQHKLKQQKKSPQVASKSTNKASEKAFQTNTLSLKPDTKTLSRDDNVTNKNEEKVYIPKDKYEPTYSFGVVLGVIATSIVCLSSSKPMIVGAGLFLAAEAVTTINHLYKRHLGIVSFTYTDHYKYEGKINKNGFRHGSGKLKAPNGRTVFKGTFKNNEYEEGTYFCKDGTSYTGPFNDNKPNGDGQVKYKGKVYKGNVVYDEQSNKLTVNNLSGNTLIECPFKKN